MTQAVLVVCDVCGAPAVETVAIKVSSHGYEKDFCQQHLDELLAGARAPSRGRPRTKPMPAAGRTATKRKKSSTSKTRKARRPRKGSA